MSIGEDDEGVSLPGPGEAESVLADYQALGLSLRRHPMSLLRDAEPYRHCSRAADLEGLDHGRFVRVAGLVTGRQRPGTAKGTLFVTLEDETGNINLVVWSSVQEHFRAPLLASDLMRVKGRLEKSGSVIHVIAGQIEDRSHDIRGLRVRARDFH